MNNPYYHEFTIGFNWWYLMLPAMMILLAALGSLQFGISERTGKIARRREGFTILLKAVTYISTVVFMLVFTFESWAGILQFFANGLGPNESPFYAFIVMVFTVTFLSIGIFYLFTRCTVFGGWAKIGFLIDRKKQEEEFRKENEERLKKEIIAAINSQIEGETKRKAKSKTHDKVINFR